MVTIERSLFIENQAGNTGGAIYAGANASVINSTIVNGSAETDPGIASASGASVDVVNTIIWGNDDSDWSNQFGINSFKINLCECLMHCFTIACIHG